MTNCTFNNVHPCIIIYTEGIPAHITRIIIMRIQDLFFPIIVFVPFFKLKLLLQSCSISIYCCFSMLPTKMTSENQWLHSTYKQIITRNSSTHLRQFRINRCSVLVVEFSWCNWFLLILHSWCFCYLCTLTHHGLFLATRPAQCFRAMCHLIL